MQSTSLRVPFLDLSRELIQIRSQIQDEFNRITFEQTNFILGKEVSNFEQQFAKYIDVEHCVSVGNGTDAIEMAVQLFDLQSGEEVITQANTYVATCLGVTNNHLDGVKIKLVDCVPETYQMDLVALENAITDKTRVIIVVHLTGACCDMNNLMQIMVRHPHVKLIEDCAQSHGARFYERRLGSFGDLSTFSFYPGKNLGALGDGGAICTNNAEFDGMLRRMRSHGSIIKYQHEIFGRNSRLDTIQAAILSVKLKRLDDNNAKRRQCVKLYQQLLCGLSDIKLPVIVQGCEPVFHLYMIRVATKEKRDALRQYLEQMGIETGIHYPRSIREIDCYRDMFANDNSCENATKNSQCILSLPMMPDLTEKEIEHVCKTISDFFVLQSSF